MSNAGLPPGWWQDKKGGWHAPSDPRSRVDTEHASGVMTAVGLDDSSTQSSSTEVSKSDKVGPLEGRMSASEWPAHSDSAPSWGERDDDHDSQACPNGHPVEHRDVFCRICGAGIKSITCSNGHELETDAHFCRECGTARTSVPSDAGVHPQQTSPPRQSPPDVGPRNGVPPKRGHRRSVVGLILLVVVIVGGAIGYLVLGRSSPTHEIIGTFSLQVTRNPASDAYTVGQSCAGWGGYSDVGDGTSVTITDGSGNLLGSATLSGGTANAVANGNQVLHYNDGIGDFNGPQVAETECDFTFSVSQVPQVSFYQVEVGNRGKQSYSLSQMEQNGWFVGLTLGDPESGTSNSGNTGNS
jgi:hypothetical protein